jgi:transcriptional regulator with XRE-family HTH domain
MLSFPRLLSQYRNNRGLTQKELATKVKKSTAFVASLEMEGEGRKPSVDTLRELILALAKDEGDFDQEMALSMMLSILGLEGDFPMPSVLGADRAYKDALNEAKEVWFVSDLLPARDSYELIDTATRLKKDGRVTFYFLVPISTPSWQAQDMIDNFRELRVKDDVLSHQVRIFGVSACAFSARLRICDPRSPFPRGFYIISPREAPKYEMSPMPRELVHQTVQAYRFLCARYPKGQQSLEGHPHVGHIQLFYPSVSAAKKSVPLVAQPEAQRRGTISSILSGDSGQSSMLAGQLTPVP